MATLLIWKFSCTLLNNQVVNTWMFWNRILYEPLKKLLVDRYLNMLSASLLHQKARVTAMNQKNIVASSWFSQRLEPQGNCHHHKASYLQLSIFMKFGCQTNLICVQKDDNLKNCQTGFPTSMTTIAIYFFLSTF